jgi:hypothetical protein
MQSAVVSRQLAAGSQQPIMVSMVLQQNNPL